MSELKRTELRHRMLKAVNDGKVSRGYGVTGWHIVGPITFAKYGHAVNATDSLVYADLARIVGDARDPLTLTDAGKRLLAEWNTKFGEVSA